MSAPASPTENKPAALVRLVGVEKKLGRQKVLKGVDLQIREGERMVIIGRSGGGKSVLLKHIIALMQPDAGEVWFRDTDLSQLSEEKLVPIRKETGMLFQNGALFDSLSVGENVAFPLRERGGPFREGNPGGGGTGAEDRRSAEPGAQMAVGTQRRHAQARRPGPRRYRQARPHALR